MSDPKMFGLSIMVVLLALRHNSMMYSWLMDEIRFSYAVKNGMSKGFGGLFSQTGISCLFAAVSLIRFPTSRFKSKPHRSFAKFWPVSLMIRSKFNEKTAKKTNCVTRRRTHELTRRKNVANESDPADRIGLHLRQFDFCVLGDATGCFGRQLSAIENGNRFG